MRICHNLRASYLKRKSEAVFTHVVWVFHRKDQLDDVIAEKDQLLADKDEEIAARQEELNQKEHAIQALENEISESNEYLAEIESTVDEVINHFLLSSSDSPAHCGALTLYPRSFSSSD